MNSKIFSIILCFMLLVEAQNVCAQSKGRNNDVVQKSGSSAVQSARLRILVDQAYGEAKDAIIPVKQVITRLLKAAGFQLADTKNPNYNLTLKIDITGRATGESYLGAGYLYTGADISGIFLFIDSSGTEFNRTNFEGHIDPPSIVFTGGWQSKPSNAPFESAFYESHFFEELAGVILKEYGSDAVLKYWLAALKEEKAGIKIWAIKGLGKLGDNRGIQPLIDNLIGDFRIDYVISALSQIGKPAVEPLIAVLTSQKIKDDYKKAMAARTLGNIADGRAIIPLSKTIKSKYKQLQIWSAFALYKLGDTQEFDLIIAALNDPNDCNPVMALGEIGDKRSIEPLIRSLAKGCGAEKALARITGKDFKQDSDKWLEWWEENKEKY